MGRGVRGAFFAGVTAALNAVSGSARVRACTPPMPASWCWALAATAAAVPLQAHRSVMVAAAADCPSQGLAEMEPTPV